MSNALVSPHGVVVESRDDEFPLFDVDAQQLVQSRQLLPIQSPAEVHSGGVHHAPQADWAPKFLDNRGRLHCDLQRFNCREGKKWE